MSRSRPRDFDNVIQLIRVNDLPLDYEESLEPDLADKSRKLLEAAQVDEDN